MYLFKKKDGSIVQAPETFDQQNPDWKDLKEVEEILVVSKILIPQIRLVSRSAPAARTEPAPARRSARKSGS